jgi:hypothetical protein
MVGATIKAVTQLILCMAGALLTNIIVGILFLLKFFI